MQILLLQLPMSWGNGKAIRRLFTRYCHRQTFAGYLISGDHDDTLTNVHATCGHPCNGLVDRLRNQHGNRLSPLISTGDHIADSQLSCLNPLTPAAYYCGILQYFGHIHLHQYPQIHGVRTQVSGVKPMMLNTLSRDYLQS